MCIIIGIRICILYQQTLTSCYLRLTTWFPSKKKKKKKGKQSVMRHARINSSIGAEHMGEALIPFYAMLDTRNAIWCPHSVWRRRNSMSGRGWPDGG